MLTAVVTLGIALGYATIHTRSFERIQYFVGLNIDKHVTVEFDVDKALKETFQYPHSHICLCVCQTIICL